jgi:hypothetical protein
MASKRKRLTVKCRCGTMLTTAEIADGLTVCNLCRYEQECREAGKAVIYTKG